MKLWYYFSEGCSCCKGYDKVARRVADVSGLEMEMVDISTFDDIEPLEGVPCIIIKDGKKIVYKRVGNVREEYLMKEINDVLCQG